MILSCVRHISSAKLTGPRSSQTFDALRTTLAEAIKDKATLTEARHGLFVERSAVEDPKALIGKLRDAQGLDPAARLTRFLLRLR